MERGEQSQCGKNNSLGIMFGLLISLLLLFSFNLVYPKARESIIQ